MAGKSDYLEAEVLKWATGQGNDLGTPAVPYVGLYTVAPSDTGGGTEVSGNGYARVNAAAAFGAPTGTSPTRVANDTAISFPQATGGAWGTVVAFAVFDGAAGDMLYWATLTASKSVGENETARFDIDALALTED